MANKQPFYYRIDGLLFTGKHDGITQEDVIKAVGAIKGVVKTSVEIEEFHEPEPGDPADLMG